MPKVSIIIPTYNRASYIAHTLDSILNQTYKDFEVVVVNDGSTDNTSEVLEKYESKIKLINQPNSERAVARNNGVKNSSGEYLAFVDSDDIWIEDKLEKQVAVLENKKDVILTNGICHRINERGEKINIAKRQTKGHSGNVFENLLYRNFIVSATPMIRRKEFEKTTGFQTQYIPYEDWEFWIRYSLHGNFYFLPESLAYYRIHSEQSVQLVSAEKIEKVTDLLLEDSYKLQDVPEYIKNKSRGLANLRYSFWYLVSNENEKAKNKINAALSYYPKFAFDPRWIGLKTICTFPKLRDIINLGGYHAVW